MAHNTQIFAFETWSNGGIQTSAFYEGDEAMNFIARHEQSGTFATLHVFKNEKEALQAYEDFRSEGN
jgi:hypothetical protein